MDYSFRPLYVDSDTSFEDALRALHFMPLIEDIKMDYE